MKIRRDLDIKLPLTPNFVREVRDPNHLVRICDLTDDELRELGAAWTEELLHRAKQQRREVPE